MLTHLARVAIEWARVNRADCNDDPCDDCTCWIGEMS